MIPLYIYMSRIEKIQFSADGLSIGRKSIVDMKCIIDMLTYNEIFYRTGHLYSESPDAILTKEKATEICLAL